MSGPWIDYMSAAKELEATAEAYIKASETLVVAAEPKGEINDELFWLTIALAKFKSRADALDNYVKALS